MPWVKGQSGNPKGGTPKGQPFAQVLRDLLDQERGGKTTRQVIGETVVALAKKGNLDAARWIVDRTEGKVPDRLEATVDGTVSVADATIDAVLARYAARRGPGGGEA